MRVGILTFHCAHNYGAVLQAFALQQYLLSQGHDVHIMDYKPDYLVKSYKRSLPIFSKGTPLKTSLKNCICQPLLGKHLKKRYDNFSCFIEEKLRTVEYTDENLRKLDCLILGSDQIWSPNLTGGKLDPVYLGAGAKCKIISYAASSNVTDFTDADKEILMNHLDRFSAISVRETSLADKLQDLVSKPIATVLDPTLIADRGVFDEIADDSYSGQRYVLAFELNPMKEVREIGKNLACQLNCDIKYLTGFPTRNRVFNSMTDLSPAEMLGLIKHAKCVVTSSFHGTAFSLIFNRPFFVVRKGNGGDARLESLLTKLGIPERFIPKTSRPWFSGIRYEEVNKLRDREAEWSRKFLETQLR